MTAAEGKVYRLRGIPSHLDRLGVALVVSRFIPGGDQRDVQVASLALCCEVWASPRTKTATLSFWKLPEVVTREPEAGEWVLPDPALAKPLLLDDAFIGLSPLNDVPEHEHHHDCIVMSGLASHPMGSWQPHGKDKSFMWIRDALPHLVPNVKFILYGYDTRLAGSKSFQTVSDIALSFIHTLQQGGWAAPGPRKLIFFAHSLGGIVLKQAMRMLADSSVMDELILNRTRGAIFFGVPSQGLDVSDLQIMLQGQPNKDALVKEISTETPFVKTLEEQFSGISNLKNMRLLWAYETETTPTVTIVNGKYKRCGPGTIFVPPSSATSQRCDFDSASTIQINANHSDMVKFSRGNELVDRIAYKLRDMVKDDVEAFERESGPATERTTVFHKDINQSAQILVDHTDPAADPEFWDVQSIRQAIRAPKRDSRLEQIDTAAGHSFLWAFEESSAGLTSWLQNDERLFWISGKPASGKSTFMKYLYQHPLTWEYLRRWRRSSNLIRATFFFHHRGTAIQKSLEGLCRGILSQALEQAPQSFLTIQPIFKEAYHNAVQAGHLGSLSLDLQRLVETCKVTPNAEILRQLQTVLQCELPWQAFCTMLTEAMKATSGTEDGTDQVMQQVHLLRDDLLAAYDKDRADTLGETFHLKRILSALDGPLIAKINLASLITGWLEATDINKQMATLKQLLVVPGWKQLEQSARSHNQLDKMVEGVIGRFSARKARQRRVETGEWSLPQLTRAIACITNQQVLDLDLCIFIDALDEHGGPPEFVVQLIKDIASAKESRTRMKILFSSRPWQPFVDAFGHGPGIQIHDFTENDIRELCLQRITPDVPGSAEVLQLVEDIVKQARGVFLWVKLVLNDLLDNAAKLLASGNNSQRLRDALMVILQSLPVDLEQYYNIIIDRLPHSYRWEAFCLLEAVSKSLEPIYRDQMADIMLCAKVRHIDDIFKSRQRRGSWNSTGRYTKEQLRTHSGGLIEMTHDGQLQLLHQTLVEFIKLPEFKHLVLGERYRIVKENGYSILARYKALQNVGQAADCLADPVVTVDETFLRYAREAELTTGSSICVFSSDATWRPLGETSTGLSPNPKDYYLKDTRYTTLELAVAYDLRLLLEESLKNCRNTRAVLLFPILLTMIQRETLDKDSALTLLREMAAKGLQIHASHPGLLALMDYLRASVNVEFSSTDAIKPSRAFLWQNVTALSEPGANFSTNMGCLAYFNVSDRFTWLMRLHGDDGTVQALHMLNDELTTHHLLERGEDPNGLTSRELTPLDCWVKAMLDDESFYHEYGFTAKLLLRRGGRLNVSTRQEWNKCVGIASILAHLVPEWLDGAPGADNEIQEEIQEVMSSSRSKQSRVKKWLKAFRGDKGRRDG